MRRYATRLFTGGVLALAAPAAAQRDSLPRLTLDTLAVSALRTPVATIRAPYAVTVIAGPEVGRARIGLAVDQALLAVPGVQVDNRFNPAVGERISVRDFGARAQFGVRGVRVLVDGLPATFPDGQTALNHVDPTSLGRVEVLRGPASALYGNASGGVIRLESEPPPVAGYQVGARVSGGADGMLRTQGSIGGAAGAGGYRIDVTRLATDGYRRHARSESVLLRGRAEHALGAGSLRLAWSWVDYDAQNPGSLTDSLLRLDRRQAFARNVAQGTGEAGRQGQIGLSWRQEGPVSLEVDAYGTRRSVDNPIPASIIVLDRSVAGLRGSASGEGSAGVLGVRWSAGAELERQDDDRRNFVNEAGERGPLVLDQDERVRNRAAFGGVSMSLAGRADLHAALRWDHYRFAAADRMPSTPEDPDDSGARAFSAVSPSVGVSAGLGRGVRGYASYSTAFETPTTTELVNRPDSAGGFNPLLRPQRTRAWEGGLRLRAGATGLLEVAAYRARVQNQLVPFEVATSPGRVFFRNAGLSRHQGVEAAAALEPAPGARLRLAYTYTDARFRVYQVNGQDVSGNPVPGISPHRFTASGWVGGSRGPFAGAEVRISSGTPVSDTDAEGRLRSPGYALLDLRAGWAGGARAGRTRLTPWLAVTNATGAEYNASVVVNAFGARFYEPGPERSLYLGIEVAAASRGGEDR